jgi:hypothetical protein
MQYTESNSDIHYVHKAKDLSYGRVEKLPGTVRRAPYCSSNGRIRSLNLIIGHESDVFPGGDNREGMVLF